jgi:hypothetical protein
MFDFTLGLQPIIHFVTRLMTARFKKLISVFANEFGQTFAATITCVCALFHI